jgi:hypothetical protein
MNADFLDLLGCLFAAEARFLIVGGYAVAAHGHVRATKDLDIWVEATPDNANRVIEALVAFGAPLQDLQATDLARPHYGFMMGLPPRRVDVLTSIDGIDFADAWPRRIHVQVGTGVVAPFLGLDDLLTNKRASGRPQDAADVAALGKARR